MLFFAVLQPRKDLADNGRHFPGKPVTNLENSFLFSSCTPGTANILESPLCAQRGADFDRSACTVKEIHPPRVSHSGALFHSPETHGIHGRL